MTSTHVAELPLPNIPMEARTVHMFPEMSSNLVAVTPLTDAGCTVTFNKEEATIQCPDCEPIQRPSSPRGVWELPMAAFAQAQDGIAMATIGNSSGPGDIVAFHHAALFSPAISTLQTAMEKNFLPPLPGLTKHTLAKYTPNLEATMMGHLDNIRKNYKSTKKDTPDVDPVEDTFPEPQSLNERTHHCYLATTEPNKNLVYTDQTGRLPVPSTTGNNYLLIAYDYDSNNILLRPIKNMTAEALTEAIAEVHHTLTLGGCKPKFHRLDNECPTKVKEYFERREVKYQLAPPNDHRTNAAERAIRTAKNHLIAGWWSMDKAFPLQLWDKTIPHAELTLNLLRGSRINPNLSAWEQLHGRYDFNATPIAPPGIKVLAHAKSIVRQTWDTHAFEAWYTGPALEHYRCHTVWAIKTRQSRIVNQLVWFPTRNFPKLTSEDLLRATI